MRARWLELVFIVIVASGLWMSGLVSPGGTVPASIVHATTIGPSEIKLPDPWGKIGGEMSLRAVEVGGLECAVLVAGVERQTHLWCAVNR